MDMRAIFKVAEGGVIHFDKIALKTDGAESLITGDADVARWPEQSYRVNVATSLCSAELAPEH